MKVFPVLCIVWCILGAVFVECTAQIGHRSSYSAKSRASYQQAIDEALKPHQAYINGARAKLSEVLDDASSQGVQYVKIWSKLSETGFIALAYINAGKRFEAFVSQLLSMDENQFGNLFRRENYDLISGKNIQYDDVVCTFQDLMSSGKCGRSTSKLDVTDFKIRSNERTYEFRTLEMVSIEEAEENIYRNLHLADNDVPAIHKLPESAMREYLYDHFDASQMFHFRVLFDGVEQVKYSQRGQGEHLSKVLHCDLAFQYLYHELLAKDFAVDPSSSGSGPSIPVNGTAFQGYPDSFVQHYRNSMSWSYGEQSVLQSQGIMLRLWDDVKDDFLVALKNTQAWKTAAANQNQQ